MGARVLVVADTPRWAWGAKARVYDRYLSDEFHVDLAYETQGLADVAFDSYDLIHLFEVRQVDRLPETVHVPRVVSGLTAHVWKTWGEHRMREWANKVHALHGNSLLLVDELRQFHEHVHYLPNGVDPVFWHPASRINPALVACHVGKPNPRKGASYIATACSMVGMKLLLCQRTSHVAEPPEVIRQMYWDSHVQVTMSDMDGTPNPMLEAAACGSALLSTRIGNMPELIVNGVNGFLIERDVDALVDKLTWMQDHPKGVREMGVHARQAILDGWAWEQQVEHVRTMWRTVLA